MSTQENREDRTASIIRGGRISWILNFLDESVDKVKTLFLSTKKKARERISGAEKVALDERLEEASKDF